MKKALLFIGVLAASFTQAQVLYVNNSNGTYQAIDTKKAGDICFEESEEVIYIELGDRMWSQFATSKITNIAPVSNKGLSGCDFPRSAFHFTVKGAFGVQFPFWILSCISFFIMEPATPKASFHLAGSFALPRICATIADTHVLGFSFAFIGILAQF